MAHPIAAFLITLAVGYWLLTLAEKQNGLTKTLGQVFAWIIIVVSLMGPVCMATFALCHHSQGERWGNAWKRGWGRGGMHRHGMWSNGMMNKDNNKMCPDCPMGKDGAKDSAPADDQADTK